uniref:Uncharacterized protein n=1 Tax=Parascaris univalens TaxID=6257 RepID=A0A914ZLG4_PARUN
SDEIQRQLADLQIKFGDKCRCFGKDFLHSFTIQATMSIFCSQAIQ